MCHAFSVQLCFSASLQLPRVPDSETTRPTGLWQRPRKRPVASRGAPRRLRLAGSHGSLRLGSKSLSPSAPHELLAEWPSRSLLRGSWSDLQTSPQPCRNAFRNSMKAWPRSLGISHEGQSICASASLFSCSFAAEWAQRQVACGGGYFAPRVAEDSSKCHG